MEALKVVFIDIDGVLNSSRSVLARTGPQVTQLSQRCRYELIRRFALDEEELPYGPKHVLDTIDPTAVGLLNRLIRETGAKPVLSTSHRTSFTEGTTYGSLQHLKTLDMFIKAMGLDADLFGITPKLFVQRGAEVAEWMKEHPQFTHAVILDDGKDFHPNQPLVWCDPCIGFSEANYFEASKLLGVEVSQLIY